jgi:hypothetical protein
MVLLGNLEAPCIQISEFLIKVQNIKQQLKQLIAPAWHRWSDHPAGIRWHRRWDENSLAWSNGAKASFRVKASLLFLSWQN